MGILAHVSFQTPEGFDVPQVYARITSVGYNLQSREVTLWYACYLTRELRLAGKMPLCPPQLPGLIVSFAAPTFPTIDMLYYHLKRCLTARDIQVEDVLEEGQVPSTYTEPDPAPSETPTEPPVE